MAMQQKRAVLEPHYMQGSVRGRPTYFCVNGDFYHPSKKVVLNPKYFKDIGHYMDHLTDHLRPAFGAVLKVHTPLHGRRVRSLEDLSSEGLYVVAGRERFKPHR
ncbi:hypothetical protein ACOMHN_030730 [Nucella lapillus]